jgi:hypothetical protein
MKMGIEVPQTTGEVPKALEAAKAKRASLVQQQAEAKKNPPKPAEPEPAEEEGEAKAEEEEGAAAAAEAGEAGEPKAVELAIDGAGESVSVQLKVSEGDE